MLKKKKILIIYVQMLKKSTCTRFFWVQKPGFFGFFGFGFGFGYPIFSGFRVRVRARVRKPKHVPETRQIFGFQCMVIESSIFTREVDFIHSRLGFFEINEFLLGIFILFVNPVYQIYGQQYFQNLFSPYPNCRVY